MAELLTVFSDAALPQKSVIVLLVASIATALAYFVIELRRSRRRASPLFISQLRFAGPAVGLLMASMNAFHMMDTVMRLPLPPTTQALAPGGMEIATLVGLGALAGLVAVILSAMLDRRASRAPSA